MKGKVLTGAMILVLLGLCLGSVWAQEAADTAKAEVTKVVTDLVTAFNAGDADAFGKLIHDAIVVAVPDANGTEVMGKDVLLGPTGVQAKPAEPMTLEVKDVLVVANVGFAQGTVTAGAVSAPVVAAAIGGAGGWKVVLAVILPPAPADQQDAIKAAVRPIWDDIEGDADTGMQAALKYLGDNPAVFALGTGQQILVMPGREDIEAKVKAWAAPADVKRVGERTEILGLGAAVAFHDSVITNQGQQRELRNLVALAKLDGQWKVVGFVGVFKPLPPAPPAPAAPVGAP